MKFLDSVINRLKIKTHWSKRRPLCCVIAQFLFVFSGQARSLDVVSVRPDYYSIEVQSTRSADKPRVVSTWAHATFAGESYRALMPTEMVRGPMTRLDFHWSPGSALAGGSEKVELEWRWLDSTQWQTRLLGEGFRDPASGHLILSPTNLNWGEERSGKIQMRFMIRDGSGRTAQDGGHNSTLNLQVVRRDALAALRFSEEWRTLQQGELLAGESFEIDYSLARIAQQMSADLSEDSPWCLYAKVQFDDGPVQNYPLLAAHREYPEKVIGIVPTVQIPTNARRMTLWFFAFHNSSSYFDSNFGQNYQFIIKQR